MGCGNSKSQNVEFSQTVGPPGPKDGNNNTATPRTATTTAGSGTPGDDNNGTAVPPSRMMDRKKSVSANRLEMLSESRAAKEAGARSVSFMEDPDSPDGGGDRPGSPNGTTMTAEEVAKAQARRRQSQKRASVALVAKRRLSGALNEFGEQLRGFLQQVASTQGNDMVADSPNARRSEEEKLKKMFQALDVDNANAITVDNLLAGFNKMGYKQTDKQLKSMFDLADRRGSGSIQFHQFYSFFKCFANASVANGEEADEALAFALRHERVTVLKAVRRIRDYNVEYLVGCSERVKGLAVSSRRNLLATASRSDMVIKLWNLTNRTVVRVLEGHEAAIMGLAFCNDKKVLGSAGRDNKCILWDCTVGHELETIIHPGIVTCITFSDDGKDVYTGCQDNAVRRFTVRRVRQLAQSEPTKDRGVIVVMAASRNSQCNTLCVSRSCDKSVRVLDATTLRLQGILSGHLTMVWFCSFSSGFIVASACERIVCVWNLQDRTLMKKFEIAALLSKPDPNVIWTHVAFCPTEFEDCIIAAAANKQMHLMNYRSGAVELSLPIQAPTFTSAVNNDTNVIYLGDDVGNVMQLNLK